MLAGFALAFTPQVYINSSNTTDYVWALAFILGSLYFVLLGRPLMAGILLGLAIGSRITSGAMLLRLGVLLASGPNEVRPNDARPTFALSVAWLVLSPSSRVYQVRIFHPYIRRD